MTKKYDAIIIGTGQSGPALANRLSAAGWQVAIIERKFFGGTCVNTGCIPTKALVASARAAYMVNRAADFGVMVNGTATVDMQKVKARKDAISGRSRKNVETWLTNMKNCTIYRGHASFTSANMVQVDDELLEAKHIFINVGGRAAVPDLPGLDKIDYLINSSMMDVDFLPKHLLILGGSYIGLEFAQMYRRFGSEVTVVEMAPRLVPREDEDVSNTIKDILENDGVNIRLNAKCMAFDKQGDDIIFKLDCQSGAKTTAGSHLFLGVGRVPNTDDLGLDKAGIKTNERGYIDVDDFLRTNVEGIYAIGDCNGQGAFTHTSYNDFEIVAANLLDNDPRKVSDRIVTYGLFIDPPLARIGMTETQVKQSGRKALIGTRSMARVGRAVERSETQGFMKILVDADSKEILGASLLGVNADEAIHCLIDIMYAKAPYTVIQRAVHIHPTVAELIPTVLGELKPLE